MEIISADTLYMLISKVNEYYHSTSIIPKKNKAYDTDKKKYLGKIKHKKGTWSYHV